MRNHLRSPALALLLAISLALGACSSSGAGDASDTDPTTTTTASPPTTAADTDAVTETDGDPAAFCAGFEELAAGRDPADPAALDLGDGSPEDVAAAYAAQLATVEAMADVAPAEMVDNAETYADVIVVRAEAAAETGANSLDEMAPADREAFIEAHAGQQAEINELLAYGRENGGGF